MMTKDEIEKELKFCRVKYIEAKRKNSNNNMINYWKFACVEYRELLDNEMIFKKMKKRWWKIW
jgi:hypothetical protein